MAGYPPHVSHVGYPAYAPAAFLPTPIPASITAVQNASGWVEHLSHDGRKYYYNTFTQQTTWEKPQELKSTQERILASCPWKEFKSENGKPYYYNEHTKQSVWVKPQELIDAEAQAASASVSSLSTPANQLAAATPGTPATPKDDGKPPEPSEIEKAMKATLASFSPGVSRTDSISIPLPPQKDGLNLPSAEPNDKTRTEELRDLSVPKPSMMHSPAQPVVPEYKTRGEMAEGLRRLFRDCNVPGGATWEQALKLISPDPRYAVLRSFNEKKQIFNVYKTQRLKEEREEQRIRAKQAKEDLEKFLLKHPGLQSTMSYRKVDQLLADAKEWTIVPDRDRRDLFGDIMQEIARREKDDAKVLRQRNMRVFNEILSEMPNLTYKTTWSDAQQMLLDNTRFTSDVELQNLDKEDALVCFERHICMLEQQHDEEKEKERRKQKREQRKNREAFIVLLDELHEQKMLTSTSLWKDLYHVIHKDDRFHKMLAQRGSTPLDLFKFYIEALKARFPAEKKLIREILKDNGLTVDLSTPYEEFFSVVSADERSKGIDTGNIRLTYDSFIEKAHGRERERQRDDARRQRKLEQNFCEMLSTASFVDPSISWDEIRERFGDHPAFKALSLESERIRVFKDYILSLDAAASEESRRSRKDKRRREKSISGSNNSDLESEQKDKRKKRVSPVVSEASDRSASHKSNGEASSNAATQKRKHRKSKKSKHRKSKHHKHRQSTERSQGDEELEEGEAADDDDEEDDDTVAESADPVLTSSKHHHNHHRSRHQRGRHQRSSDPEDGEELDSGSDADYYERDSKRKRR